LKIFDQCGNFNKSFFSYIKEFMNEEFSHSMAIKAVFDSRGGMFLAEIWPLSVINGAASVWKIENQNRARKRLPIKLRNTLLMQEH
jgi:hypothetical protein